jgi:hypothetical protein
MSAATQSSLMPASSRALCSRLTSRALLDLRLAIAGEVAQLADRLGRHEVGLQQPRFGQLAQPHGVRDVGLASGDLLDVSRVDEHAVKLVFEDRPRRLPVDAGRFHHDLRDAKARQPVAQRQQPADGCRELSDVLLAPAARCRHARAGGHLRLVHVQRGGALHDGLHCSPPPDRPLRTNRRPGPRRQTNLTVVLAAHSGVPGRPRTPYSKQAHRHQGKKIGVTGDAPNHPPLFKTPEGARQRSENSEGHSDRRVARWS